jgi:hypothetical protein
MKLYTEEQVREVIMSIDTSIYISDSYIDSKIEQLKPIELPNDDDDMLKIAPSDTANSYEIGFIYGFEHGAKCVINYIKEQYNRVL